MAFANYQTRMQPSIAHKQLEARRFIRSFVPNTNFGIHCRNLFSKFIGIPWFSSLLFGGLINEKLDLRG